MSNDKNSLEVGLDIFAGLLDEFRRGNIANKKIVRQLLKQHVAGLTRKWDERFPGFPKIWFPYLASIGLSGKEAKTAHLKKIIVQQLESKKHNHDDKIIVNPACFFGRRSRYLASRLKSFKIIATDINPGYNKFWKYFCRTPANYEFRQDNIFNPKLKVWPSAVVFFGACGSVTDAAMDYAIELNSPYLFCRTCCHHIIGGNTGFIKDLNFINWLYRLADPRLSKRYRKKKDHYFSPVYSIDHYPRSKAARRLTDSNEFLGIICNAAGSGICRTIIDLDRYLYLAEHGYNVWYREEMFVAERTV
jgi:uncharacterized UPF0146 family protein